MECSNSIRQLLRPSKAKFLQGTYYVFHGNNKHIIQLPSSEPLEI